MLVEGAGVALAQTGESGGGGVASAAEPQTAPAGFKLFQIPYEGGYTLTYPESWQTQQCPGQAGQSVQLATTSESLSGCKCGKGEFGFSFLVYGR